jgi:hypothetical protein
MALYLEGKTPLDANDLSPKEATQMSRDIKYIGMDVHKEATVIAVLNGSGKLIMESIVETKASSILQFIHGLRGELHVTWEEGTWAAWLYELLQPQAAQVLVCDPRRNRSESSDESDQSSVSRLEHPLCRYPGVCSALSGRVVRQDRACGGAPAG